MIIDTITLHNFGVYGGRHTIELTPTTAGRPIVLFGGLNGGGKTTFLDALLLALYGKFAKCSNRGNLSYEGYLKKCINRNTSASEGASIELEFRHRQSQVEERIKVCRTWRASGKGIREDVAIFRDGQIDPECTDRWYEFIEELIPSRIANLFFFDGEKIEDLATPEQASTLLRTGVHALLGLDLIETLEKDLKVVERRRKAQLGTTDDQERLTALQAELDELETRSAETTQSIGQCKNELDSLLKNKRKLEQSYMDQGGDLYDQRAEIMSSHERTSRELMALFDRMREIAAGDAPLLLVQDQLRQAENQCQLDRKTVSLNAALSLLQERDSELLGSLKQESVNADVIDLIAAHLDADLSTRKERATDEVVVDVPPETLTTMLSGPLETIAETLRGLFAHSEKLEIELDALDRKLESIPDPEGLEGVSTALDDNEKQTLVHEHRLNDLGDQHGQISSLIERKQAEIDKLLDSNVRKRFANERSARVVAQTSTCRELLSAYREKIGCMHIARLERTILDSYLLIMRKRSLVANLSIDPQTFRLTLFADDHSEIQLDRLSAGERQLLAIAILWGLSKASGQVLPTVIDTPLGRLDGAHRENLVESYFPAASHQVILLSTDKEIDEHYYKKIAKYIDREYSLEYDDSSHSSEVVDGYFWRGAA